MTDSLFDLPESKSPRLLWMEKHQIECGYNEHLSEYQAYCYTKTTKSEQRWGRGPTELDAIADLAIKLNIPLWNEQ